MRNFRNWDIWLKSRLLTKHAYEISQKLPDNEKFGLISQIRRASVSIPSNIAEGASRSSEKELKYFLQIAIGSGFELETLISLCVDLKYLGSEDTKQYLDELDVLLKMLNSFITKLNISKRL
jgi:four helix bundle protein